MIEGRHAGRALRGEPGPCHVVGELQSAFVPVALIFVPVVAWRLEGLIRRAQVGAASQHLHRHGLIDRLKPARLVPHYIGGQAPTEHDIEEPGIVAESDEPGMGERIGEHAQFLNIVDHG